MAVQDILLGDDGDLLIRGKDLVIGPSDDQHNQVVMIASPGDLRNSPITGVALLKRMKSRFTLKEADTLRQDIQLQLQADGALTTNIQLNSVIDLNVDASR